MSMKLCPIQELCQHFSNGSKRKVHHIRISDPCRFFLDMTCEESIRIQMFLGETMACDINKIKRIKEKIKS